MSKAVMQIKRHPPQPLPVEEISFLNSGTNAPDTNVPEVDSFTKALREMAGLDRV